MQAAILAGGLGTRLKPITEKIPKCMAPVGDKPFLFYLLSLLRERGIDSVVLCTGYLGEQVVDYFGDGGKLGLTIQYSREKGILLGTGGALKLAEKFLNDSFLVINGDTYLDINYVQEYAKFVSSGRKALIIACPTKAGERSDLELSNDLVVTRFDKEGAQQFEYVNAGVLALKKSVVSEIDPGRPVSLEKEIFPRLVQQHEMIASVTEKQFYDIGTFANLGIFKTRVDGGIG